MRSDVQVLLQSEDVIAADDEECGAQGEIWQCKLRNVGMFMIIFNIHWSESSSFPRKSDSFFDYIYSNKYTIGQGNAGLNFFSI